MSLHHHRGAVADENSVNWTLRQETGKRVVVTRHHRKRPPLGFCAQKVHVAHGSPRRGRGRVEGGRLLRLKGERLRILWIAEGYPTHGPFTIYSASCNLCSHRPDRALGAGPIALAQEAFQYFPGAAFRQIRLGELHMARNLVVCQALSTVADQSFHSELHARLQHDACCHYFSPLRIWYAENCHLPHSWMVENNGLNLTAIHIFAACDDHVLLPVKQIKESIAVLIANVSSAKEAISEGGTRFPFVVPVSTHHVRTARHQLTSFTGLEWVA